MTEDLWLVLPLRAVVFQSLLLLISIALESLIFQRILNMSRKTATEYSIVLNLLSTFVGWLCFFVIESITPEYLRLRVISYVFFNKFVSAVNVNLWQNAIYFLIIRSLIFWVDFTVEIMGLDFLLKCIPTQYQESASITEPKGNKSRKKISHQETQYLLYLNRIKFKAAFWANFTSNILVSSFIVAVT